MAKQPAPECGRCIKPTPATATRRFRIDDDNYKIELCEKHNEMFDREIVQWSMYGDEDPAYAPARRMFSVEQVERDRAAASKRQVSEVTQPALIALPDAATASDTDKLRWIITPHARERMAERKVSEDEAILAAAYPERTGENRDPSKYGRDARIHYLDDVAVVVDTFRRVIITVYPRLGSDEFSTYDQRRRAAAQ